MSPEPGHEPTGPLAGVRVIDISTSYAAPTTSMYLADLGAEVIKVERPKRGDDTRGWGPPFVTGEAAWFLAANRNKRSICVDLRSPDGYAVLMRLLETAHVFVENLNPSKLGRLKLEPDLLRERFPGLIVCAVSGFGLTGPDRDSPGYDLIAQARSGLMSVTGAKGGTPQRVSTALSDIVAGTIAALAVCAALREQARSGRGELVDVSLLDADLSLLAPRIASFLAGEAQPVPSGGTDSVLAIYQPFETADHPIVVAVGNDEMWQRFCLALDLPQLAADERLATNAGRRAHRETCIAQIGARLATMPAAHWLRQLGDRGVPRAPIQFLSEVVEDGQVLAREMLSEWEHPTAGLVRTVGPPWRLGSPAPPVRPAPGLGEHTEEILREAGFGTGEIAELRQSGGVWSPKATTSS